MYWVSYLSGISVQRQIRFGLTLLIRCQPKLSSLFQSFIPCSINSWKIQWLHVYLSSVVIKNDQWNHQLWSNFDSFFYYFSNIKKTFRKTNSYDIGLLPLGIRIFLNRHSSNFLKFSMFHFQISVPRLSRQVDSISSLRYPTRYKYHMVWF